MRKQCSTEQLARVFGCSPDRIVDFYGMVESVGVIYPDCSEGNKHGPVFGDVIVRNPLTLEPVAAGEYGIVQVCSVLPTSFPGHLLLTEDRAQVIAYDGCPWETGYQFPFCGTHSQGRAPRLRESPNQSIASELNHEHFDFDSCLRRIVNSPAEISGAAVKLRQAVLDAEVSPNDVMTVFDSWAKSLDAREFNDAPGIPFLRMWLRRGTLEPIIARELGPNGLHGGWNEYGRAKCKAFPVGVVGHWPAGNVEIQPILSMTCALLGGNAALVRIPSGLVDLTQRLMEKLVQSDPG